MQSGDQVCLINLYFRVQRFVEYCVSWIHTSHGAFLNIKNFCLLLSLHFSIVLSAAWSSSLFFLSFPEVFKAIIKA